MPGFMCHLLDNWRFALWVIDLRKTNILDFVPHLYGRRDSKSMSGVHCIRLPKEGCVVSGAVGLVHGKYGLPSGTRVKRLAVCIAPHVTISLLVTYCRNN
jgi:hypothetical protein